MKTFLCVLGLGLAGVLAAEDQRFTFALPEEEGRISLGVFDAQGALVRTLAVAAEVEDFSIGLNGLMATWNGQTDQGKAAPAGKYFVRGFVVGDTVKTEGVAYHFNDWVEERETDRFAWIQNFQLLPDGSLILVTVRSTIQVLPPVVVRYLPGEGVIWSWKVDAASSGVSLSPLWPKTLASAPFLSTGPARLPITFVPTGVASSLRSSLRPSVAADEQFTAVGVAQQLCILATKTGELLFGRSAHSGDAQSLALEGDSVWVGTWGGLTELALPALAQKTMLATPVAFDALALVDGGLIGGKSGTAGVWRQDGTAWQKLEIPLAAGSVSAGKEKRFWVAGNDPADGNWQVGEFGLDGEFHSSYRGDLPPVLVSASGSRVGVLEENASRQRLVVLERNGESTGGSWEIVFEKTIERNRSFVMEGEGVKADGSDQTPPTAVKLVLEGHGLETGSREVTVKLVSDGGGLWLATDTGLKIVPVTEAQERNRRLALKKNEGSLTAYSGDGMVVEEFVVRNLESQLAPIDAGEIDLP